MTAKDLKNALLQEAVQGKLVPQIASEGNARDLLNEIRKEKSKLIKEGKLKKEKPLPEIAEEDIPFDIPENWCWCRLGEIVPFGTCKNAEPNEILDEDWILDLEDIEKDTGKILSFKTKKQVDAKSTKHIFLKGNILYSKLRPYLNKCVIAPKNGFCTSEILPLDFGENIYNKYAQLFLMSPFFVDYTNSLSFGVKMPRLGTEDGKKALFPLPPLAEQKRIVSAIEKFMPLIEEYGNKESELKAFNEQIGRLTKKAILQEAVQGKLVPQIATEGNAKDLLEEIKKEKTNLIKEGKIKKEKPLPEITEEEIPFDIPENWCWCKIEDITIPIGNKNNQIQSKEVLKDGKIPVVSQGQNLIDGYSNETEKAINDIPVIMFGDHTRNVKYIDFPFVIGADGTKFFKPILCNKYYIYYLITFISLKLRNRGYARHYSLLKEEWLPLPPLAEQKRIVTAIEKMLPLCEKLGE